MYMASNISNESENDCNYFAAKNNPLAGPVRGLVGEQCRSTSVGFFHAAIKGAGR